VELAELAKYLRKNVYDYVTAKHVAQMPAIKLKMRNFVLGKLVVKTANAVQAGGGETTTLDRAVAGQ
jgi:hypothetical protein